MGDMVKYVPEIILSLVMPRGDNIDAVIREAIAFADDWVDSVELHRSESVHVDDRIAFPATIRLKIDPCPLRSAVPKIVELTARDICRQLVMVFPSERYSVNWGVRFTSVGANSMYTMTFS